MFSRMPNLKELCIAVPDYHWKANTEFTNRKYSTIFYFRFTSAIFFTVIISVSGVRLLDWAPHHKCRYSRWNFTNRLFLTEGFTTSGLRGAILDSCMSVHDNMSAYPCYNYEQNKYMTPKTICS